MPNRTPKKKQRARQRAKAPPVDAHLLCYCCRGGRTAGVCKDSIGCPVCGGTGTR